MIRCTKWGTSTCAEQREMVYVNVIKVSLIPRRELNYVVKTEKGERPSRGVRNAINESKKVVNCGARVDGGI